MLLNYVQLILYDHTKFLALQPINIIPRYYTQIYIAKSVLMVAPHAIIFIEFLQMVKIPNNINRTVIIITVM